MVFAILAWAYCIFSFQGNSYDLHVRLPAGGNELGGCHDEDAEVGEAFLVAGEYEVGAVWECGEILDGIFEVL